MKNLIAVAAVALTCLTGAAFAQVSAVHANSDALYKTFGEKPGLVKLMDDLLVRLLADPRTSKQFKEASPKRLKEKLVEQFCVLTGGPCTYTGDDMKEVHAGLKIDKAQFNAVVEILQHSMDAQGIPFASQNQLLAKLAPMHREIITVK